MALQPFRDWGHGHTAVYSLGWVTLSADSVGRLLGWAGIVTAIVCSIRKEIRESRKTSGKPTPPPTEADRP